MSKLISLLVFIFFIFVYFLISLPDYSGDIKNHVAWGESIYRFGTFGFYGRTFPGFSFPTYPPFIVGLFALSFGFYEWVVNTVAFLNASVGFFPSNLVHFFDWENTRIAFLKLAGIIATVLMGFLIYHLADKLGDKKNRLKKYLIAGVFLLNPAIIYLSAIWGQTDVLQFLFIILAFYYLLFDKKLFIAFVFSALAILSKQTAILLWGVFMLVVLKEFGWRKLLLGLGVNTVIFYLAYLPFHDFSFDWPVKFYYSNFTLVNFLLTENAINFWGMFSNFLPTDSTQKFFYLTFDNWGYLMFLILVMPLTLIFLKQKMQYERLFHYLFLVSIIYFFVLTRMHERYLIPGVILGSVLIIFNKKYWLSLILISIIHFLNLYRGLYVPQWLNLKPIVDSQLALKTLVVLYGFIIVWNYYLFVKESKKG